MNNGWVGQTFAVLRKDVLLEWQGRSRIASVIAFAVTVLLLFSFAGKPDSAGFAEQAGGTLWLALLLASVLALADSFRTELEDDALLSLQVLPVDARALFLGKAMANTLLLLFLGLLLLPVTLILFDVTVQGSWTSLIAVLVLGAAGLAAPGTLYAAMTAQARGRDVMLPLLLFPLVVPVLLAAVNGSVLALAGDPMDQQGDWLGVAIVFNVVYWTLCPVLMARVIEE